MRMLPVVFDAANNDLHVAEADLIPVVHLFQQLALQHRRDGFFGPGRSVVDDRDTRW